MGRRRFLQSMGIFTSGIAWPSIARAASLDAPIRTITSGPKHHWFGYYDKLEFDPTNRFVLANQVDFEHRTPRADDGIRVGMIDTWQADQWIAFGQSTAWGWQQGCMLQWRPNVAGQVVWNDREGGRYVSRLHDVQSGSTRTIPMAIYTVSPDGRSALSADFARIQRMRPGYGYVGITDPAYDELAPEGSGVWHIDLDTGQTKLVFSLADAASIPHHGKSLMNKWNYFNHLLVSPDSRRFIVLHRWRENSTQGKKPEPTGGFSTRMFTVAMDGSDRYLLDSSGRTSHFIWRDPNNICAWSQPVNRPPGFYLFEDQTNNVQPIGKQLMPRDGHVSYLPLPDKEWLLCDTYPDRVSREQTLYLFHRPSAKRFILGKFYLPPKYVDEWRCDLHPRSSNDGRTVAIDSPHTGAGRQVHLIDISHIIG